MTEVGRQRAHALDFGVRFGQHLHGAGALGGRFAFRVRLAHDRQSLGLDLTRRIDQRQRLVALGTFQFTRGDHAFFCADRFGARQFRFGDRLIAQPGVPGNLDLCLLLRHLERLATFGLGDLDAARLVDFYLSNLLFQPHTLLADRAVRHHLGFLDRFTRAHLRDL